MKYFLQGIGIIFTLIASFLGLMYTFKGDIMVSSLLSLVIIVIEYFLIEKFIQSKSEITKNRLSTLSIILWSIYILLAIPISFFLLHALNVEINAKKEIQKVANQKIADLDNMVAAYQSAVDKNITTLSIDLKNKLTLYNVKNKPSDIASALQSSPYNIQNEELNDVDLNNVDETVNNFIKAKATKANMVVEDTLKPENTNFKARYGGVFDGWSRLHLNYAFYELDNLLKKNKESLVSSFELNLPVATEKFDYNYNDEETYMNNPIELFNKYKPYYLIFVVLLFHLLILLPYFIEPVSGEYISPKKGSGNKSRSGGLEI